MPHLWGGVQVGLDDREVDEPSKGAPSSAGRALLDFNRPDGSFRCMASWTTPGSLEAVGSGKDQGHGSGEEVPGGVEGARGGDGA
jgi:hypothetical protein